MPRCGLHRRHGMDALDRVSRRPARRSRPGWWRMRLNQFLQPPRTSGEASSPSSVEQDGTGRHVERGVVELEREVTAFPPRGALSKPYRSLSGPHSCGGAARCVRSFLPGRYRPLRQIVSLSAPNRTDLLFSRTEIRQSSPQDCGSARRPRGLFDGLIWPKTGCASIV